MKGAAIACARAASSRFSVPFALTPKSVCGSLAAQSWDGCAAVWMTSSIDPACSAKIRMISAPSRMSTFSHLKLLCSSTRRWVTCEVDDSGPKKRARMSFSIPTTSKPWPMKWSTASDPIRPPAPVMIATGTVLLLPPAGGVDFERGGDPVLVGGDPLVDVGEPVFGAPPGAPLIEVEQPRAVGKIDGDVPLPGLGDRGDRHLVAGQALADAGGLAQREAALVAAAGVHGTAVPLVGIEQLPLDQVDQVLDVQKIAHLLAMPPEPDVGERVAEIVGEHPVGEHPLVDLSHLPGAGDDAETVDHGGHAERRAVLLDQQPGGQPPRPLERPRPPPAGSPRRSPPATPRGRPARRRARTGSPSPPASDRPAAPPGTPGWSRGRRRTPRRVAPTRGSCRRRSGWCGRGSRSRRRPPSSTE